MLPLSVNNSAVRALECLSTALIVNFNPLCKNSRKCKNPRGGARYFCALSIMYFDLNQSGVAGIVFFILLIFSLLIYLGFYAFLFSRIAFYKPQKTLNKKQPVSVIICAKNELENLEKNLPMILHQNYDEFEVIVVNDHSYDESLIFLKEIAKEFSNFKVIHLDEQEIMLTGKKFAQTLGIKGAKYEVLLFTDADCRPTGPDWISTMQANYSETVELVLGYGRYVRKPGLLNKIIRYDTFSVAMQYFSMALAGSPYMGVGRNLSYKRSLFFKNKGFASHQHIQSGDDDLFVNEVAQKNNTAIEVSADSHTLSEPKTTWSEWFRQKRRHLTTGSYYKAGHKFTLAWYYGATGISTLSFIVLFALMFNWQFILGIFLLKCLIQWLVLWKASKWLSERDIIIFAPVFEPIMLLFNIIFSIGNAFSKQTQWK